MDEQQAAVERIRAALIKLYPDKGFERMDGDILVGSVVWATMSSPDDLTLEDAIQILERVADRSEPTPLDAGQDWRRMEPQPEDKGRTSGVPPTE